MLLVGQKLDNGSHVLGRTSAQKQSCIFRQAVAPFFFSQKPENRQIIAQNPDSPLGRIQTPSDLFHLAIAFVDRGEQIEFDRRLQRRSLLMRVECLMDMFRRWPPRAGRCSHRRVAPVRGLVRVHPTINTAVLAYLAQTRCSPGATAGILLSRSSPGFLYETRIPSLAFSPS